MTSLLNNELLEHFDARSFMANDPCPWSSISGLLNDDAFARLNDEFPSLALFEKHEGRPREHVQRPHNRYYLAFERSLYGNKKQGQPGCAAWGQLSAVWQQLITELQANPHYRQFTQRLLGVDNPTVRFAWHVAGSGDDVSPHCDAPEKAGTHIFYFNTSADWQDSWGGSTVFLSGKKTKELNPEMDDFERQQAFSILDNRSLLFKNTPDAWHGVDRLRCPAGRYRRVFNVVIQHRRPARPRSWVVRKARALFSR